MTEPPVVAVFTGLRGTGKSTMADLLASPLGAPSFDGDWLLGALARTTVLDGVARPTVMQVYCGLLTTLLTPRLSTGPSSPGPAARGCR